MGILYVFISLVIIGAHFTNILICLRSYSGCLQLPCNDRRRRFMSCVWYQERLYSNEAGVGSAPNASASADVTHPAKQGLVQTVSVYIDTILLCTATALMCLSSGTAYNEEVSGAPYVQDSISTVFGKAGPVFITAAMILFAFTTLIGNLYYVDNALTYLNRKCPPSKKFMTAFYIACIAVIFFGAITPMDFAWTMADITMGGMTLINIPCCFMLSRNAVDTLRDYEKQKREGKDPVFHAEDIGLDSSGLSFWK